MNDVLKPRKLFLFFLSVKCPSVCVSVGISVVPHQFFLCQFSEMEFCLSSDTAAYIIDDFLSQFSRFFFVAVDGDILHQFHSEAFFDAGKVEVFIFDMPFAWTDVIEDPCCLAAVVESYFINLTGRVEGASVVVEVHGAGLMNIDVAFFDVVVPSMLISVMTFYFRLAT